MEPVGSDAGAPQSERLARAAADTDVDAARPAPPVPIFETYGTTRTGMLIVDGRPLYAAANSSGGASEGSGRGGRRLGGLASAD